MTQLVAALRYKTEGCGFDSRWGHWNFSVTIPSTPGKFLNVVFEKDGEDQLDRSCEKQRSVT
jgi:hypothetical protein